MKRLRLLLLALPALLAGACSATWTIEHPEPPALLGAEVDSVVVRPFTRAPQVEINDADLALFAKHLREALDARERLRTFDEPPTRLPNTVVLAGRVERVAVDERSEEALVLRTIQLTVELSVLPADGGEPITVLRRTVDWQKLYPGGPVSALALDLEDAVREMGGQLAAALAPRSAQGPVVLRDGRDPETRAGNVNLELIRGNHAAASGRFHRAKLTWQQVLFNPEPKDGKLTYRISRRTLNTLRAAGLDDAQLEQLAPMVQTGPLPLVEFRARVRERLGGVVPQEGQILTAAASQTGDTHRVLAAAHANLGTLYALEGRYDLAAYHWAHAWGHDPDPTLLERWRALQAQRNVLPRSLTAQQAIELYLRLPPPSTVQVVPGPFERTVVPVPAFAEADAAPAGTPAAGAPAAPAAATDGAADTPAVQPAGPAAGTDPTPGEAAGSGPGSAPAAPAPGGPTSGTAPSSR